MRCDLLGRRIDIAEICIAVTVSAGRADGDEHQVSLADRLGEIRGELQSAFAHVLGDQLFQARFVDGDPALLQCIDLASVDVDAGDVGAELGEAGAGNQTDVAGAYHCNTHYASPL